MNHFSLTKFSVTLTLSLISFVIFLSSTILAKGPLKPTNDSIEVIKKNLKENKAILVDVRSKAETEKGYLEGAVLLPVTELQQSLDEKKIHSLIKEGKIVYTYCVVGKRALAAGEVISTLGYDVRPLKLGYKELVEAGFKSKK